jgi:hypothetical protein
MAGPRSTLPRASARLASGSWPQFVPGRLLWRVGGRFYPASRRLAREAPRGGYAEAMEYGSSPLSEAVAAMEGSHAYVRAALELNDGRRALRTIHAVVGASPPSWKPARWEYQRFMLVAA